MKKNKKIPIIISVILIVLVVIAFLLYLYMSTDFLKSNSQLFAKYLSQNEENIKKITDFELAEVISKLKSENKYEANTDVKILYSEGGEISNPLNDLAAKINIQNDKNNEYAYLNGKILYNEEEYLETELIKSQNVYGVRFPEAIKQFVTVEKNNQFEQIVEEIGFDIEKTETLSEIYENKTLLEDEFIDIITSGMASGEFSKQKNTLITYNNDTVNTNAYSVSLDKQQVKNILTEILNNIKNEADFNYYTDIIEKVIDKIEFSTLKITVYEYKQKTIKTLLEIDQYCISIENIEQNNEIQTKISYSDLNEDNYIQVAITIDKINEEDKEEITVTSNVTNGEDNFTIILSNLTELGENKIQINSEIKYKKNITTIAVNANSEINIGGEIENIQTLDEQNSKLMNSIKEEKRKDLIDQIKEIVFNKFTERIDELISKLVDNDEEEISQTDINKFNAKFEFYTGEEVSSENVKVLLDIVKDNLNAYEFLNEENDKMSVKLMIEKDKTDENGINKILERINSSKKYSISIEYNNENGLIDYIKIDEN